MMAQDELFAFGGDGYTADPLTLYADRPTPNYLRQRNGQPFKVTLRSRERKGRIVATVYTGLEDAEAIVRAVNAAAYQSKTHTAEGIT